MAAATSALGRGAGDVGWSWHLDADALRARGHREEIPGCHGAALSPPRALAEELLGAPLRAV